MVIVFLGLVGIAIYPLLGVCHRCKADISLKIHKSRVFVGGVGLSRACMWLKAVLSDPLGM
ncbi:hypothetical protein NHP190003_08520 [Helicobacter sp. NHP19-003]|uniref:Uncharacterized protein n=1 Tax=Helicobacter gastrocanis TaxID=2849641 RepID=A0ABM7SAE2_9HELI|nr:hypothetical protein NHP190003_08520 [Helicobacter sp. NHP19-003]